MSCTSLRKLLAVLALSIGALAQNPSNIDLNSKGSRPPWSGVDSGAANAYVVLTSGSLAPTLRTLSRFYFLAAHANSGSSTLNVDSTGVLAIKKWQGGALVNLVSGDIILNQWVEVGYDGTEYQCLNCSGIGTLAVASGGTGDSTLTAHAFLLGEGSSAVSFLSLGAHQVAIGQSGADPVAKTIPDCQDSGGNHLNFTQSTDVFNCGTSGGVSTPVSIANGGTGQSSFSAGLLRSSGIALSSSELSGDVATSGSNATTLASVVTAGSCGDTTHSCGLTYDVKGRITAATNNAIAGGGGGSSTNTPYSTPVAASSTITYTGMSLWLSADCIYLSDGSTCASPANGTSVTVWQDRSGNWTDAINSTTACTLATSAINGLPAVSFNGSCGKYVLSPVGQSQLIQGWRDSITIFAVAKAAVTNATLAITGGPTSGSGGIEYRISGSNASSKEQQMNNSNIAALGTGTAANDTSWHQINLRCTTSSYIGSTVQPQFRIDRTADATLSGANCSSFDGNSNATNISNIGWSGATVGDVFNGSIAEIIVYQRFLSSTEITAVESYLNAKYGL